MLQSEKNVLNKELNTLLDEIESQIKAVKEDAVTLDSISPYHRRTVSGDYILAPLLAAKAQALAAKVHLNKE